MSATTFDSTSPDDHRVEGSIVSTDTRALSVRRGAIVAAPVLAGAFALVGVLADPAPGMDGLAMYESYAANPEPLQWKSLGYHWSYSFWMAPALLLAAYVKGRGAWLANIAAVLAFVGMTTLPGMLFIDYYDSAIGQVYGAEGTLAVTEQMETMWGVGAFAAPGMVGFMLALPLATLALWRAGLVRWWAPASVAAGYAAFVGSDVTLWGCAATAVFFTVFAVALVKATRPGAAPRR